MDIAVSYPAFNEQRLTVRAAGLFSGPRVILNGQPVLRTKGVYIVRDDRGTDVAVRLKSNFIDPIPTVTIGDENVQIASALSWYEYVWVGIPILLVLVGGALGGGIGFLATYANSRIIRSDHSLGARYVLTGLISICAIVVFLVAAVAFQCARCRMRQ